MKHSDVKILRNGLPVHAKFYNLGELDGLYTSAIKARYVWYIHQTKAPTTSDKRYRSDKRYFGKLGFSFHAK